MPRPSCWPTDSASMCRCTPSQTPSALKRSTSRRTATNEARESRKANSVRVSPTSCCRPALVELGLHILTAHTAEDGGRDEKDGWLGCQSGGMGEECERGGLMGGPGARQHAPCSAARARFDARASGSSGMVRELRSRTAEGRPAPCAWMAYRTRRCSTATREECQGSRSDSDSPARSCV